jgi:hypothetical protein
MRTSESRRCRPGRGGVLTALAWANLLLVVGLGGQARGADYPDAVLAESPIAYWRLNETTERPPDLATNRGSLGAAGHGLYFGAPLHQQPGALAGDADPAVTFDGGVQKLDIPHHDALNPSGALTVELWVRAAGGQGTLRSPISSRHLPAGQSFGYLVSTTLGNQWEFRTHNGVTANKVIGGTVQLGAWTHLVGVYDGIATRLYVNGTPVGFPVTNTYAPNTVTPLRIGGGANEGSGAFFWPGSIDEVALYGTALTASRISAHHAAGTNGSPASPYHEVVLADRPVGYWRLNEPVPPPLAVAMNRGSLGAVADGTYQSGATPGDAGPQPPQFIGFEPDNRACAFDGTNGFVSTLAGLLNRRAAFTLTGWIKRAGPQGIRTGLFGQNDSVEFGYVNDATLHVRDFLTATNASATNAFADGLWNHVAVVSTGTKLVLYTNAALAALADASIPGTVSNNFRFNIGGGGVFDPVGNFFKGSIDEVAVFDRPFSFEQVAAQYFSAVATPPRIAVNPPANTNVFVGDTLSLSVAAVGPGTLWFQWYRSGEAVPGQSNSALVLPNLSGAGAGPYTCRVTNAYGAVTSAPCAVTVLPATPPAIVSHPQAVTTYAGLDVAFCVTATGSLLAYQWQANAANIPGATNHSLLFSNVQPTQAAAYRAIVSNGLGTATSAAAALTVLVPASGSFAASVVGARPLAYWRLNEVNGATAFDYAGGQHATTVGQVSFGTTGPGPPQFSGFEATNRGCCFDGVDACLTASNSLLNARSNFTLLGWINRASEQADSVGIWGQKDVVAFGFIDATTLDVWSPRGGQLNAAWPFSLNEWHFVALVGSGGDLRLYLDGLLAGVDGTATAHYGSSPSGFNIGGGGIFDGMDISFDGAVDEVALFDRALTAGEICGLYRAAIQSPLRLRVERSPVGFTLSWFCGTLQQADALRVDGLPILWTDVSGATSPYRVLPGPATRFYRLRE